MIYTYSIRFRLPVNPSSRGGPDEHGERAARSWAARSTGRTMARGRTRYGSGVPTGVGSLPAAGVPITSASSATAVVASGSIRAVAAVRSSASRMWPRATGPG